MNKRRHFVRFSKTFWCNSWCFALPQDEEQMKKLLKYYLSYGSNLNRREMATRCPHAKPQGVVMLDNARLVFRGVADVIYNQGTVVPCGLWLIHPMDEAALDRYEGVGAGLYFKDEIQLGKTKALIYTMAADGIMPPNEIYLERIRQGYRDFGLDQHYLDEAVQYSWEEKDPCSECERRRRRDEESGIRRAAMPEELALKILERRFARYEEASEESAVDGDELEFEDEEDEAEWDVYSPRSRPRRQTL